MPISASTLNALQKVGAAAFVADDKLKKEIGLYAQRVNTAVFTNPYSLGNDVLIESWKVVARLSKTLSGIEEELRNVYRIASELAEDDQPSVRETPALAAPTSAPVVIKKAAKKSLAKSVDLSVTTVRIKKTAKKQAPKAAAVKAAAPTTTTAAKSASKVPKTPVAKGKKTEVKPQATKKVVAPVALPTKPTKKAPVVKTEVATPAKAKPVVKAAKVKTTNAAVPTHELAGNPAKLLAHLQTILNAEAFEHLNQTVLFKETGIPLGSIGATLGRLTKAGRLVAGPQGSYKLASVQVKAAAEKSSPVQPEVQATTTAEQQA